MKNSLKTSVKMFGVAGLVILAGCGADTTVNDTTVNDALQEPVEVVEEVVVPTDGSELVEEVISNDEQLVAEDTVIDDGETEITEEVGQELEAKAVESAGEIEGEVTFDMPYSSPAGPHTMPATLNVIDGVVVSASTTPEADATNGAVKKWQAAFAENFSAAVEGQSIAQLQDIDAIGGASLTTGGFKEALAKL